MPTLSLTMDPSVNHERVEALREKLDNLTLSDYHGLHSPGLTCYLNSVLQLLFMTEDFRASIKQCCSKDSTTIHALLKTLFEDLERSLARTHCLVEKLGITDVYEQRDAAEYFEKILCLTSPEASQIFKGELKYETTCVGCKKSSGSRVFFWMLPLAMENSSCQTHSVERGLKAFFRTDRVCGENRMYCTQCDTKQDVDIDCEMTQNPKILTLLLKRFTFDHRSRHYVKLHGKVDVPQTLHVKDYTYDLYAVVHHFGNLTGGHYAAVIKSYETGEWYCFNDNIVDRVQQPLFGSGNSSVRSSTAYLLLYRKVSTRSDEADGVDQEVQCARADEAEGGEAPAPHRTQRDGSGCRGQNVTRAKKSCGHSSRNLEQRPNQGEAWVRGHEDDEVDGDKFLTEKSHFSKFQVGGACEPNRRQLETNSGQVTTHFVDRTFEQTHNCQNKRLKQDDITWDKTDSVPRVQPLLSTYVTNRRELVAELRTEGEDTMKPGQLPPFLSSPSGTGPADCRSSPPRPRRHSSNAKRNGDRGLKPEATQTAGEKTARERKRKNVKKCEEKTTQQPWR